MLRSNQRGVTLLELLVAMMLLATALVGLAAAYPLLMQGVTIGGFQTTATLLAQQCIEIAKSMPYDRLVPDLPGSCPATLSDYPAFTRTLTVTPASPTATTTTVTTQVDFTGAQGSIQTIVATIISQ